VKLEGAAASYQETLLSHELVTEWADLGRADPVVERYEMPLMA
jgi:hypothetical protein